VKLVDEVVDASGMSPKVVPITFTIVRGIYNPEVEHGAKVVNRIVS